MRIKLPVFGSALLTPRSANDHWKNRWNAWVSRSIVAGAAIHLILLIVIPTWRIVARPYTPPLQFIQIDPLMSTGGDFGAGDEAIAASVDLDNLEIEIQEGGEGGSDPESRMASLSSLFEIFGLPGPTVVNPVLPSQSYGRAPPPAAPLTLEEVIAIPRLATIGPNFELPVIRNPTVLQRFLRSRYNPVHEEGIDHSGFVSVTMWIDERGAVEWSAISSSSGSEIVDQIALAVFNDVVLFTPARSEGRRVPISMVISVPFTSPW